MKLAGKRSDFRREGCLQVEVNVFESGIPPEPARLHVGRQGPEPFDEQALLFGG